MVIYHTARSDGATQSEAPGKVQVQLTVYTTHRVEPVSPDSIVCDPCGVSETMSRFAVAPHGSKGYFHLRPTYHFPQHYIDMWNAKYGGMTIDGPNTDSCSTSWCAERYGVECVNTVSSPSNGYGCDGAWETFPTQQMNRAGTSSKRVDLIPCGAGYSCLRGAVRSRSSLVVVAAACSISCGRSISMMESARLARAATTTRTPSGWHVRRPGRTSVG